MKKLLILLTLGLMFGQTKLETRVHTIENISIMSGMNYEIDINQILGFDVDYAIVTPIDAEYVSGTGDFTAYIIGAFQDIAISIDTDERWHNTSSDDLIIYSDNLYWENEDIYDNNLHIMSPGGGSMSTFDLTLSITAEFPDMDTGYMEEDFDFCINEGLNLVSYPCENDIAINDALPSEISNNLSSIVGEGVAGVNLNGTWVGSLQSLSAGSGYWFNSNIEAYFNYECAEN